MKGVIPIMLIITLLLITAAIAVITWSLLSWYLDQAENHAPLILDSSEWKEVCVEWVTSELCDYKYCMATCIDLEVDIEGNFTCGNFCKERHPDSKICTEYALRKVIL